MVSGTVERFLQKGVALRMVYEKVEPNLIFTNFVTLMKEESNGFMYSYDSAGMSGDSKKETPPLHAGGAKFPELDISRPSVASALTQENGFAMRIPRDVIKSAAAGDYIQKCYRTAGFWLAEWINTQIGNAITAGATTPTWTPTAVWSAATATPLEDMRTFKNTMKREGFVFRMTDMFVHNDNLAELEGYLVGSDIPEYRNVALNMPISDTMTLPIEGKPQIHGVFSGITEGYVLGVDKNNPGAELHYYNDSKYATPTVSYETIENGRKVSKTVQNLGIHFSQYEEDESHDTMLQFWCDQKTVVTQSYALQYDSGI